MSGLSADQAKEIAEAAAEKAVRQLLTSLGIDPDKLMEERKVWAFARTMQQGTSKGVAAMITGFATAFATTVAGSIWLIFFNKPHP
ncbi:MULTISPECIES: hypothetical protein [unclassified Bradyrhizobium]|uniref:hypothetical protein n=1 Tax=unclassified Bradyrhizobium TaxID=2631580 RepID=UPI0028E24D00|nr:MULTISPECIES: hypothetical protein [unclassified Bradyrhizobium]